MRKKKGFTLIELTIVLAIIAILIAIAVPSWGYFLQRSRFKAQNAKAKVVFNAAQTIVTDLEFYERHVVADYNNAANDASRAVAASRLYTTPLSSSNEWYFYWDGTKGYLCDSNSNAITDSTRTDTIDTWNEKISRAVTKIADPDDVFRIYIRDYTVMSVATASSETNRFIGSHPVTFDKRLSDGVDTKADIKSKRENGIKGVNMKELDLPDYETEKGS